MKKRATGAGLAVMAAMLGLAVLGPAASARAETYEIHAGDDLWGRLAALEPGDEVIVHAGTYAQTSRFEATWAGTEAEPIVVRAAEGEARPLLTRDSAQNLMNLHGTYFTMRGLELTGGSHGIRMSRVEHALFEDLLIHDTGDVGMSCNIPDASGTSNGCAYVTIRDSEIHSTNGTGEGLYLGCNSGGCAFRDSIIEHNYIHDLGGSQGDGIEIKSGSWGNIIRDNVIFESIYPGITIYTFDAGAGRMPNVIERNVVVGSSDNGIQVTGRAIVRNNIVIGSGASGIASQPNQGTPTEVVIVHNTVVGAGDSCFRANDWSTGTGFVVANNAFYCEGARAIYFASAHSATVAGNVGLGSVSGAPSGFTLGAGLAADLGSEAALGRVYPPAGSSLIDAADPAHPVPDDFDLRARGASADVGAYERDASGMPAWVVASEFKELEGPTPGTDGGPVGDAGTTESDGGTTMPGGDASTSPDGGAIARDGGTAPADTGSCSCRVGARHDGGAALAWLALALAAVLVRRRR